RGGVSIEKRLRSSLHLIRSSPEILLDRFGTIIRDILRPIPALRHRTPGRPHEEPPIPIVLLDPEPALVHQRVMRRAEQDQILEARLPAVRPMLDVVRLDETLPTASRETTPAVPCPQRPLDRFRHRPRL